MGMSYALKFCTTLPMDGWLSEHFITSICHGVHEIEVCRFQVFKPRAALRQDVPSVVIFDLFLIFTASYYNFLVGVGADRYISRFCNVLALDLYHTIEFFDSEYSFFFDPIGDSGLPSSCGTLYGHVHRISSTSRSTTAVGLLPSSTERIFSRNSRPKKELLRKSNCQKIISI